MFLFLTALFIVLFGNYVLSLESFTKYSNNSNNSYAIVQPNKNVIAFAYDLSSNKGKGIFYNENAELLETEIIIETLYQNVMMAPISETSYLIITFENKKMDLIYVNYSSTEILYSFSLSSDNYINSLFSLSNGTFFFTQLDDSFWGFNFVTIKEERKKKMDSLTRKAVFSNQKGFIPCEPVGTGSMLCFYILNYQIFYAKYSFSKGIKENGGFLPISSDNFVYLNSFSIDTNKLLLLFCDEHELTGATLELSENNIIIVYKKYIGYIYQPDSMLLDCLLINKTMFICSFGNPIFEFTILSINWPYFEEKYWFPLNIKVSAIKLALFGSRPAIFYTKDNNCYFQFLLHPICDNLSFELFIKENVQFNLFEHIKKTENNIYSGDLAILIISLPISGKVGESKTDPIILLAPNQTYPISQDFIYLSDYSVGEYYMKFAGSIGEDLIGQYCKISFIVKGCYFSCASCRSVNRTDCLSCRQGYYPLNDVNLPTDFPCYNESTKPFLTYLNPKKQKYEDCNIPGSIFGINSNTCVNCKDINKYKLEDKSECIDTIPDAGYELTDENYNYYTKCKSDYYYITDTFSYKCAPSNNCEDIISSDRKVKENQLKECVKNCLPDKSISFCEYCTEKSLFLYNNQCLEYCPVGYLENATTHTCDNNVINEIEKCLGENCKESVIKLLENNIANYNDTKIVIHGYDFTAQIYSTSSKEDIANTSIISLGECEMVLRKELEIPQNEKLLVSQIDIYSEDVTPKVKYKVYRENGKEVDLSLCNKIPIEISFPINPSSNISIDKAKSISELGYDIYNTENDFYNDICASYSENGYDISLSGRREMIYQNVSFCDNGCQYKGINYDTMKVICQCQTNSNKEETQSNNVFSKELLSININVMKCYKQFFNLNNLKFNIGFYFNFVLLCGDITLFVICRKNEMKRLFSKINYYFRIKSNPPQKGGDKLVNTKNTRCFMSHSNFCSSSSRSINDTNLDKLLKNQKVNSNESDVISSPSFILKNEKSNHISNRINLNQVKNNSLFFITKRDINNYPYNLAITKDKRSCFSILINIFAEKQMFLRSIYVKSTFELITLNISLFLSNLSMYFTLNALFYTDTLINSRFKGELSLVQNLLRSIYSCLVSCVLLSILKFSTSISPLMDMLVVEVKYKKPLYKLTNNAMKIIKRKLIIFYIIEFIFMFVFLYYLSCFCIVYHSTQVSWFLGGLTSFGISLAVCVGVSSSIAILKTIGLKCKIECLYNLSLFIKSIY